MEIFWVIGHKGKNNLAVKKLITIKMSNYQRLKIGKLL